ncbi:restriction endonuclease subunit S [Sandarakinorhabdus sp. AAP62]|uniref:restriction endonuclease subunit S n=1 Tax=Sandarakinorhabdus sp. AAP62 TaxID=1248916 RepID=UPI0003708FD3|nr:restriction endonuclease subunit S [Sandarakinorhabdus sp. AAP62]
MSVPAGYKMTELGVLPNDWDAKPLNSLKPFITSGSRGWAKYYAETGDAFVRITNLSRENIYPDLSDLRCVKLPESENEGTRTALCNGDVLVSITADIGIIGYVDDRVPKPAYINQHIATVRVDQTQANPKFLSYFLATEGSQRRVRATTDAGAKAGMSLTGVGNLLAAIPPTVAEQSAIAEALSDMDEAIAALEAVIAKKCALKTATMQALLSGTRRLPGFSGEWESRPLAALCSMKSGFGITSKSLSDYGPYRCFGGNGFRGFTDRYTHEGVFPLVGRVGALCGNVTLAEGKFFASEHAIVVSPNSDTSALWLAIVLRDLNLNKFSEASAQPVLVVSKLLLIHCLTPPTKDEQDAIASVAMDMDSDIAVDQAQLVKLRQVKIGMMQQLLTGKIRLA